MSGWVSRFLAAIMVVAGTTAPAVAQLSAPQSVPQRTDTEWRAADLASLAAKAEIVGNSSEALRLADAAIKANPNDAWAYYDRAEALQDLKRTNEALAAYREAEKRFASNEDWGKSVAIYGEARALAQAGQCADARAAYERYATFVQRSDARSADMARRYATDCTVGQALPRQQPQTPAPGSTTLPPTRP